MSEPPSTSPPKDHGKALVITALSGLLILGIGHLYVGWFRRGVMLIAASAVFFVVGFVGGFGFAYDDTDGAVPALVVVGVLSIACYFWQLYDVHCITRRSPPPHGV